MTDSALEAWKSSRDMATELEQSVMEMLTGQGDVMNLPYWEYLKRCTLDDVMQYQTTHLSESQKGAHNAPLFQWIALSELDSFKENYENGDSLALLDAIATCARRSVPMPEWVEKAYLSRWRIITHYKEKTLDDAFGKPFKKGTNLNALKKRRDKSVSVCNSVKDAEKRGQPIDDELFEQIASPLGIGKTLAKEYYAHMKKKLY